MVLSFLVVKRGLNVERWGNKKTFLNSLISIGKGLKVLPIILAYEGLGRDLFSLIVPGNMKTKGVIFRSQKSSFGREGGYLASLEMRLPRLLDAPMNVLFEHEPISFSKGLRFCYK